MGGLPPPSPVSVSCCEDLLSWMTHSNNVSIPHRLWVMNGFRDLLSSQFIKIQNSSIHSCCCRSSIQWLTARADLLDWFSMFHTISWITSSSLPASMPPCCLNLVNTEGAVGVLGTSWPSTTTNIIMINIIIVINIVIFPFNPQWHNNKHLPGGENLLFGKGRATWWIALIKTSCSMSETQLGVLRQWYWFESGFSHAAIKQSTNHKWLWNNNNSLAIKDLRHVSASLINF